MLIDNFYKLPQGKPQLRLLLNVLITSILLDYLCCAKVVPRHKVKMKTI